MGRTVSYSVVKRNNPLDQDASVFLNLQVLIFNLKKYGKNSFLFGGKA